MWSDLTTKEKRDVWHDFIAYSIVAILGLIVWVVFSVLPPPPPPEKDWCYGEFGHPRPEWFCE